MEKFRSTLRILSLANLVSLRSGSHIESAEDFHNAIEAGVDVVMHLPAFPDLSAAQARSAGRRLRIKFLSSGRKSNPRFQYGEGSQIASEAGQPSEMKLR